MTSIVDRIVEVFAQRGSQRYGEESVTQMQHALQSGQLAVTSGAGPQLVAAALLHDIGHLLVSDELTSGCEGNLDDSHEAVAYDFLLTHFGSVVADPVRLHVLAKRYLCSTDPRYEKRLSPTSRKSYYDQGGAMDAQEIASFEAESGFHDALKLRRWDDAAKDRSAQPPELADFIPYLEASLALAQPQTG